MARRTPGGGGSTERPPSSTRSFSSHSPPGVDPDAPQLDAATLAKIVDTALPAAVALLNRLRDVYATSVAEDGGDWDLTTLVGLVDEIENKCHTVVQYSEHVTYHRVLSRHGSEIEGIIARIIAQLKQSDHDFSWMMETLQDERDRITESLRPLNKTFNGLRLDSPEYKQLLNEMRVMECDGIDVEVRYGHVYQRLCAVRILWAELRYFQGSTQSLSHIPSWEAMISANRSLVRTRLDKLEESKTEMARTDAELARPPREEAPLAALGSIKPGQGDVATTAPVSRRVTKRIVACLQSDIAELEAALLTAANAGVSEYIRGRIAEKKRELDAAQARLDARAARAPVVSQADTPVASEEILAGASADSSPVDDHSTQAVTEPRCNSLEAVEPDFEVEQGPETSSQSLVNEVESDDQHGDTGTQDCAVSDDGQPSTPSLAQSSVSGDDGAHDVEEIHTSEDGVRDLVDESTPPPPHSSSLKIGMSWAEVDDDDDTSANDSGAANESATQPISYAAAVADGLRPPSTQPTPITSPAIGLTSVAAATVSPRPRDSSRRDRPRHILQRPPDIAGGATAGEPRRHDLTLSCAPIDTALAIGSPRMNQKKTNQKTKKKKTDSKGRQNVGGRQGNGAPATAVCHDDTSDDRSLHSSVPAAGPRQETPSSASHENQLWPAASRHNSTHQGRGALVNGVGPRSAWGQTVERRLSLKILQLTTDLDQVQQRSVLDSALARRETEMLEWKMAGLRQENERLRIELSGCATVQVQPCYDVDDDLTVGASNCSGHALSDDAIARTGAPPSQPPQGDVDVIDPTVQGGIDSSILDTVSDTVRQPCVVTLSAPESEDVTVASRTDQGRATTTELDLGHAPSAAPLFDRGREHQSGATEESADLRRVHPTDRGRAAPGQLQDLASSTPPPTEAIRQTTSTDGLQDIEGLPKPKRKRRRGKRRRKGKGKTRRRPGHSLAIKSSSNDSVSSHTNVNSSHHRSTRSKDHSKSRRPARHPFKAVGTRRQQSLFKDAYTGYIPSSGFYYREVRLSPTCRPMFLEGGYLKPAKDIKDQNLREPHAKEVSLEPLDWTGCYLAW